MKKKKMFMSLVGITLFGALGVSQAETILFHVKTALDKDDAQICVAPNVALAAQEIGDKVIMLIDASAVTSFTKGWGKMNFGDKTPLDKAALPERERKSLSNQLNIPLTEIPKDYGEYFHFLKNRGSKVYLNRTMLTLYKIDPSKVDSVAEIIDLNLMLKLFKDADKILVY